MEAFGVAWSSAVAAAEGALAAAAVSLPAPELAARGRRLAAERVAAAALLDDLARDVGSPERFSYLLVPRRGLRRLLGLPATVRACVFNLDGVLAPSTALHLVAWAEALDGFLRTRSDRADPRLPPPATFDPQRDYERHVHGRPRRAAVAAFLASRGISVPDGDPDDPPDAPTVAGIANRKRLALLRLLEERGVRAYAGARRYLALAGAAGLARVVVSGSTTAPAIVREAGLEPFVDACLDGGLVAARRLAQPPAPDVLLAACELARVAPGRAAAFEASPAGIAAARAAGFRLVVGVDPAGDVSPLASAGADVAVPSVGALLERSGRTTGAGTGFSRAG